MPLARPPLFRLPISRHFEGGIRRRRHLLEHVNAAMELAHPAGAEPLAPQPSQLASAVASTKKSLLAILRNLDGRAQPSPNAIPVARKIKKSAQDHALSAPVIGRADGRAERQELAASAYHKTMGQGAPNICKRPQIWLSFCKNTSYACCRPLIQPPSG